jgi:hypothetical protein
MALLACASIALSSLPAPAEQSCAPKSNAAKNLRSKNVNDVDPNWDRAARSSSSRTNGIAAEAFGRRI